jgi:hypothetical protein
VWYTVTCSYSDWSRRYKRTAAVHSHPLQSQFVVDAKQDAVNEMLGSGQPRFAGVTTNQVGTAGLQVNLPNDPGQGYRQI